MNCGNCGKEIRGENNYLSPEDIFLCCVRESKEKGHYLFTRDVYLCDDCEHKFVRCAGCGDYERIRFAHRLPNGEHLCNLCYYQCLAQRREQE